MSKKIDRANIGPSMTEVVLGVILSLALGVTLAAGLLITKPVVVARELPKEPDPKAIYYIEGSRDPGKGRQAAAKRSAFVKGETVSVNEDELNALATAPAAPAAAPAKDGATPPPAPPAQTLAAGAPNFRIREGKLQIAVPLTISAAGFVHKVFVLGKGGFVKEGEQFVFDPETLYVGSCPVVRLPFVSGYVQRAFLSPQLLPEELATAWAKAGNVAVEGDTLTITMQ